jgi:hypothetical protein
MPTARELLEQADALMRRNRSGDTVQPLPAAAPLVLAPAPAAEDDFPLLTDVVDAPALTVAPAIMPRPVAPLPLPTEAAPPQAALVDDLDHGEPSYWLEPGDEDRSVLGVAPDSLAVVPPASAPTPPQVVTVPAPTLEDVLPPPVAIAPLEADFAAEAIEPVAAQADLRVDFAPVEAPVEVAPAEVTPVEAPIEVHIEALPEAVAEIAPAPVVPSPTLPVEELLPAALFAPVVPAAAAVATLPAAPADEAHWQQLAEDVRMQVLQRIDIFTDTGLREQLGARLKPIVDRASADLVATINEHVGELLRTYVAEAIEREIERWRHDGKQ